MSQALPFQSYPIPQDLFYARNHEYDEWIEIAWK
jgi:hypothetical protein